MVLNVGMLKQINRLKQESAGTKELAIDLQKLDRLISYGYDETFARESQNPIYHIDALAW
ncbi:hypothetical protein E4U52_002847, partial [Claviceps spartinae]